MTSKVDSATSVPADSSTVSVQPEEAAATASVQPGGLMGEISSPHELTDWVDNVIDKLENRFGAMREQVEDRMNEMSTRIDALESSIQELINNNSAQIYSQPSSGPSSSAATSTQQYKEGDDS